jgi:hypothetical protein
MGVLKAWVNGAWVPVGGGSSGGGASDVVWVDPNAPTDPNIELWYDTDASGSGSAAMVSGRNLLDNGQMAVKQRSLTTMTMTSGTLADRWTSINSGVGTTTLTYTTYANFGVNVPAGRPRPGNVEYIMVTVAEAAGALAAGDLLLRQQNIEGQLLQHLNWGSADAAPLTFSFDVFSHIATTFVVELQHTETVTRSISRLVSVPVGFSTQIVSFPGDTVTPITNDAGGRLALVFWIEAGSNFTSGPLQTAWGTQVAANRCAGISNALAATANNIFAITNCQLEIGTLATPYEVRRYDDELAHCQRYLHVYSVNGSSVALAQSFSTLEAAALVVFPVTMRSAPAFSYVAPLGSYILWAPGTVALPLTALGQFGTASPQTYSLRCTVASGLTLGSASTLLINAANLGLIFSAEI